MARTLRDEAPICCLGGKARMRSHKTLLTETDDSASSVPYLRRFLQLDRRRKRAIVLMIDIALCFISAFAAFSLRVGALAFPPGPFFAFVGVAVVLFVPIFFAVGAYSAIFRFAGPWAIKDLARATVIYAVPLVAIFMVVGVSGIPRTIAVLHPMVFFGFTSFSRIAMRQVLTELQINPVPGAGLRRALIYGAGSAGLQLAHSLRHVPGISLAGFIDDDSRLDGQRLEGFTVYDSSKLEAIINDEQIDMVLLALPKAGRKRWRQIINRLQPLSVKVQTLPPIQHVVDGRVSFNDLREIQIEDLLGRDSVAPNAILLSRTVIDKVVMVTGAGGSIGSELCRQICNLHPRRLILVEMTEHALYKIEGELREMCERSGLALAIEAELLTLIDPEATRRLFRRCRPDTVFHAAAYKHVPLVERNVISGLRNNIVGTRNAALSAIEVGTERFILVSTDKAVRPTNVMGASKRVCELVLQALAVGDCNTRLAMVRFGNVLGSSGSVVPRFLQQIQDGGPVTLTHRDVTRYFMTIPEAAQLVIQAGAMAEGGEVYLLDMGDSVRIYDLACTMIELSGLTLRDDANPNGDVEIIEVGLRPGEKLYEELLIAAESESTIHPQIYRATESALSHEDLEPLLQQLLGAINVGDRAAALSAVSVLVPEYTAQAPGGFERIANE